MKEIDLWKERFDDEYITQLWGVDLMVDVRLVDFLVYLESPVLELHLVLLQL